MIDLSELKAADFESLCYDLLAHMGLQNLQWRKGQNEGCSSADNGRDIEGELFRYDLAGSVVVREWFVECKHWKQAVPPTAIHGLITWARAERPDVAVIISSGALSNPTHDWIKTYQREDRPSYRIKEWGQKTLAAILPSYPDILVEHGIATPYTSPLLLALWRDLKIHELDYLFALLDEIPHDQVDRMLGSTYQAVLPYRMRRPESGKEKIGDLLIDPPSYEKFKQRCCEIVSDQTINEGFLVHAIVAAVSRWLAFYADPYETAQANERCSFVLENCVDDIARLEAGEDVPFPSPYEGITREDHIATLRKNADDLRAHIASAAERTAESREILWKWEQHVLIPFLNEDQLHLLRLGGQIF